MFQHSEKYYELIYQSKNYQAESARIVRWISQYRKCHENTLLDVACGIGSHITHLKKGYNIEGLDINQDMLTIAQSKHPEIKFYQGDMINFQLNKQYGAVISLFSSIGYVKTFENLKKTIQALSNHTLPGGIIIVESWFSPEVFIPNSVHATYIDEPNLKVSRMCTSKVKKELSILDMHYLVGTPEGVEHFSENHEMGLFTHEEYMESFKQCNLETHFDPEGLINRTVYIGIKTL